MIDPPTQAVLQAIVRREGRSLLQYVGDAFPWTAPGENGELSRVQQIIAEDRASQAEFVRFLTRQRITPPYLGAYPEAFTSLNFIALDHLLPRLAEWGVKDAAQLEADLASLSHPEAQAAVQKILDMKRRHAQQLQEMAAAHRVPASR